MTRESEFVRWHEVHPGPDRPEECTTHRFYLAGASGTVQFVFWWYDERSPAVRIRGGQRWMGLNVGYHSPVPRYDEQPPTQPPGESCEALRGPLRGRPCFYDGSVLLAGDWGELVIAGDGTVDGPALDQLLADEYHAVFGEDPGDVTPGVWRSQAEVMASMRENMAILAESGNVLAAQAVAEFDQAKAAADRGEQ